MRPNGDGRRHRTEFNEGNEEDSERGFLWWGWILLHAEMVGLDDFIPVFIETRRGAVAVFADWVDDHEILSRGEQSRLCCLAGLAWRNRF
jgi:hypothetical protein